MIVASHRGPYRFERDATGGFRAHRGAGGIVSALLPLLTGREDTRWIAAALSPDDAEAARAGGLDGLDLEVDLLEIDETHHRMHLDVIANGVLWFLHHGLFDLVREPRLDADFREAWTAYCAVNDAFAAAVADRADPHETVLVQDYQLGLVPGRLRELRPDLRVVHFTHTPFCDGDAIGVLPDDVAAAVCGALASGPAGFHTRRWADGFRRAAAVALGPDHPVGPVFAAPLGPDVPALAAAAAEPATRAAASDLADIVGERQVILRIDRIEPAKNIVRGFAAYDRLLEARPGLRRRVVFVAMCSPSRPGIAAYRAYAEEVTRAADAVNDRWATDDWLPVVLDVRDDYARSLAGLERYDVLLVNPLRDGLNLVAKEGPALNRRDGVLCLSRGAGAYEELAPAVVPVHAFDLEQAASALDVALAMPFDERAARAALLRERAGRRTPADWLRDLVRHADEQGEETVGPVDDEVDHRR